MPMPCPYNIPLCERACDMGGYTLCMRWRALGNVTYVYLSTLIKRYEITCVLIALFRPGNQFEIRSENRTALNIHYWMIHCTVSNARTHDSNTTSSSSATGAIFSGANTPSCLCRTLMQRVIQLNLLCQWLSLPFVCTSGHIRSSPSFTSEQSQEAKEDEQ